MTTFRTLVSSLVVAFAAQGASSALADVGPALAPIAAECRPFLQMPSDAKGEWAVWERRVTIATCDLARTPDPVVVDESQLDGVIAKLRKSIEPSVLLYQQAMASGPADIQFFARYQLGMAYSNLMVRARNTIAIPPDLMTDVAASEHFLALHRALEPRLMQFARDAEEAFSASTGMLAGR
jgi:hypothetical protein